MVRNFIAPKWKTAAAYKKRRAPIRPSHPEFNDRTSKSSNNLFQIKLLRLKGLFKQKTAAPKRKRPFFQKKTISAIRRQGLYRGLRYN